MSVPSVDVPAVPSEFLSMVKVKFFRPDGREVHTAGPFPWVRVTGEALLAGPGGEEVARHSGGLWILAGGGASRFVIHGSTCTLRFEGGDTDDSSDPGLLHAAEFLDGAVYAQPGRRLLARLDEQSKAWYAYDDERAWAGMVIERAPG